MVRGYGLALERRPLTRFAAQIDLSPMGRGEPIARTGRYNQNSSRSGRVHDEFFLGENLERAVAFHVDGIPEVVVNCRKHGDHRSALVILARIITLLTHSEPPPPDPLS